jgi:hypothetical protein
MPRCNKSINEANDERDASEGATRNQVDEASGELQRLHPACDESCFDELMNVETAMPAHNSSTLSGGEFH